MIKHPYTYIRMLMIILLLVFLFFDINKIAPHFLFMTALFVASIPIKHLFKEGTLTYFESKLNYFFDEFYVYAAVILLSIHNIAPFWVIIIYFYKDATIGAIRNFAIKENVPLEEKYFYKVDKAIQYTLIFVSAIYYTKNIPYVLDLKLMFYISALISALTLILFFITNREFMKKIHDS